MQDSTIAPSIPDGMMVWTASIIADTQTLNASQFGGWFRIRMALWRAGGSIKNDPALLARITGMRLSDWTKQSGPVLAMFTVEGDRLSDPALSAELRKTQAIVALRREAGGRGGRAKSLKTKGPALANATILPEQKVDFASETQTQTKKEDSAPPAVTDLFERFLKVYPKRDVQFVAKTVEAAFVEALKACADPETDLIGGAKRYAEKEAAKGNIGTQFIKSPVNWLHDQFWQSYPAPALVKETDTADDPRYAGLTPFLASDREHLAWNRYCDAAGQRQPTPVPYHGKRYPHFNNRRVVFLEGPRPPDQQTATRESATAAA
jgi:uncharacterized protein YdaU (DUF1376 family)